MPVSLSPRLREMNRDSLAFIVEQEHFAQQFSLWITTKDRTQIATTAFAEHTEPGAVPPATMTLNRTEMQALLEELWRLGFRPLDGTGNPGHIGAMERHLEDMRAIVASELKVKMKGME